MLQLNLDLRQLGDMTSHAPDGHGKEALIRGLFMSNAESINALLARNILE
jgi:hypothetical protein